MRIVLSIAILLLLILVAVGGYLYFTGRLPMQQSAPSDALSSTEESGLSSDYPTDSSDTALTDGTGDSDLEEDDQLIEMKLKQLDAKAGDVEVGLNDKEPDLNP